MFLNRNKTILKADEDSSANVNIDNHNEIINIKNLKISFPLKRGNHLNIIRGVDFSLREGQIVGIVGESGSGKSVTTKAFMNANGRANMTFDSYKIFNRTFSKDEKVDWSYVRSGKIAYIPQNPSTSMNPSRKIGKQVMDVLEVHRKDLKTRVARKEYILEMFNRFKIDSPKRAINSFPHELSGGQKQRVIICMGIMTGARIVIADEPTTALDATIQASVLELLTEINKNYGVSIIFISHNISVVSKLCDYIYVMYAGKVVEKAPKKQLFTDPRHPYTWALIAAIPEDADKSDRLYSIPGSPPDMKNLGVGDPFAPRNKFAVAIDYRQEPPLFKVSNDHYAATWMMHPLYPKVEMPKSVSDRVNVLKEVFK